MKTNGNICYGRRRYSLGELGSRLKHGGHQKFHATVTNISGEHTVIIFGAQVILESLAP
jgi:hypothetical protein